MKAIRVPVKRHDSADWGDLCSWNNVAVEVIAERVDRRDDKYTFIGNHRVRRLKLKKNVHFKLPQGTALDISDVKPATAPRRQR